MEQELKKFIYHKNGWSMPIEKPPSRNKNINGEKIMRLYLDGKCIYRGPVQICQMKKKQYCANYGISKERAKQRFRITY